MEARNLGTKANRLPRLRRLLKDASNSLGSVRVGTGYQAQEVIIGSLDLVAILQTLIERDEQFLASFNVKIERP